MVARAKKGNKTRKAQAESATGAANLKLPVDAEVLRRLYARMLRCRLSAERNGGGLGAAKEAAIAAATIGLQTSDAVSSPRKDPAIELATGHGSDGWEPDGAVLDEIPVDATGSSQVGFAAGVALSYQMRKTQNTVVVLADAQTLNFGTSHEALQFTAAHKLPMVILVDAEAGPAPDNLLARAETYGIPAITVGGSDAVAVYRVAHEAISRARSGRGPSLIECRDFGSGTDTISHIERYLEKHGWWTPAWKRELVKAQFSVFSSQCSAKTKVPSTRAKALGMTS